MQSTGQEEDSKCIENDKIPKWEEKYKKSEEEFVDLFSWLQSLQIDSLVWQGSHEKCVIALAMEKCEISDLQTTSFVGG